MTQQRGAHSPGDEAAVFYDATYARFGEAISREIRVETWGEDIGQNGWITAAEQDAFIDWLGLGPASRLLDIACGSGGPALRIAERTGAHVTGVDINVGGITAARATARERGLSDRVLFEIVDAGDPLAFPDESFDAVMCIDAINHLPDRPRVLSTWKRLLKPGGRMLYTDPVVVTGPVSREELATRSSIGFFLFVPPDANKRMLAEAGLRLVSREDLTEAVATTAGRWHAARAARSEALVGIEGGELFEAQQRFLEVTGRLARERRLSRFAYLAER